MLLVSTPNESFLCITHLTYYRWLSYPLTGINYEKVKGRLIPMLIINLILTALTVAMLFERLFDIDFALWLSIIVTVYITISFVKTPIAKIPRSEIVGVSMGPIVAILEYSTRCLLLLAICVKLIIRDPTMLVVGGTLVATTATLAMLPVLNYFWLRKNWETLP